MGYRPVVYVAHEEWVDEEDDRGERQRQPGQRSNEQIPPVPDEAKGQDTQVSDANIGVENRREQRKEIEPRFPGD